MAKNTISVTFKLNGDNKSFNALTGSAKDLKKAMRGAMMQAEQTRKSIIKFSQLSQAFSAMSGAVQQLSGMSQEYVNSYNTQVQNEQRLATVMKERMSATDETIQSIKNLCSEQQKLGVIGDEVQLAGAQQLATFVQQKSSLDTLIPAMNNLIAQQKGLNATETDAISIGNLFGKAMTGQVSALKKVGISFTEDQKKVMQFGTEQQKAAMLAEIITQNVGNMNEELAKTPSGQLKQVENNLGDIKERIGEVLVRWQPFLSTASSVMLMTANVGALATSAKAVALAFSGIGKSMILYIRNLQLGRVATLVMSGALTTHGNMAAVAAIKTRVLAVAIKGLLVATGVGIALVALTSAIEAYMNAADAASTTTDEFGNKVKKVHGALDNGNNIVRVNAKSRRSGLSDQEREYLTQHGIYGKGGNDVLGEKGAKLINAYRNQKAKEVRDKIRVQQQAQQKEADAAIAAAKAEAERIQKETLAAAEKAAKAAQKGAGGGTTVTKVFDDNANTIEGLTNNVTVLRAELDKLVVGSEAFVQKSKELYTAQQKLNDAQKKSEWSGPSFKSDLVSLPVSFDFTQVVDPKSIKSLQEALAGIKNEALEAFGIDQATKFENKMENMQSAFGSIASAFQSMGEKMGEGAQEALQGISSALLLAQAIAGLVAQTAKCTTVWEYIAAWATGIASITAAFTALPFANGGIISGPTLGLMGEYPGAKSNPEVVAPLNKLKAMLGSDNGKEVRFVIDGTQLIGVENNTHRIHGRSGRRTNIIG